ncbi:MAG: hypothetical protein IPK79_11260 [Vampirovibrionales bacterium]|nr:hypothetical protein [Vampirovibrionales bacterium]
MNVSGPYFAAPPSALLAPSGTDTALPALAAQLGQGVTLSTDGLVRFNEPLVQRLTQGGAQTTPLLSRSLMMLARFANPPLPALLETLYVANCLADVGVPNIGDLYPAASAFNTHPHPLTQIYLAGLYRKLNRPEAFGPLLATLTHQAVSAYPAQTPMTGVTEEVGGAALQLIANRTAEETVRRLAPYLRLNPPAISPGGHGFTG